MWHLRTDAADLSVKWLDIAYLEICSLHDLQPPNYAECLQSTTKN